MRVHESDDTFPTANDIPVQAFADLVAQYHHRLLSLEAELKDCARAGRMSTATFSRRVKRLKKVHAALGALQRLCIAESPQSLSQSDIGLPTLSECTPAELAVIDRFLIERAYEVADLESQTSHVYRWLSEAALGKAGALKITLRLSKLRAMIQAYDKRTATLGDDTRKMTVHCERLVATAREQGMTDGREFARTALEGLMELFHGLDGTIQRVARLKAALKKEEDKTRAVSAWLREQEAALTSRRPNVPPPTPLATTQAMRRLPRLMSRTLEHTKRRKDLVERFWHDVLRAGHGDTTLLVHASPLADESSP